MRAREHDDGKTPGLPVTPELYRVIVDLIETSVVSAAASLGDIRAIVLGNDMFMSGEGEIMYKQDRPSLLIKLDELIEQYDTASSARHFLSTP